MTVFLSVCERERGGNGNSLLPMPGPYNPEGSGHTDRSLRGREEPMEHQVMARGIAGPNPCHNLRASGVLQLLWELGPTGGTLAQGDYAPSSDGNHR